MTTKEKGTVLDEVQIKRALTRISHEILERNKGAKDLVLIGIRNRGDILAGRIQAHIENIEREKLPLGVLDITLYRDDFTSIDYLPKIGKTEIPFNVSGKIVILVDDVLYTGRTVRAALDEIINTLRTHLTNPATSPPPAFVYGVRLIFLQGVMPDCRTQHSY